MIFPCCPPPLFFVEAPPSFGASLASTSSSFRVSFSQRTRTKSSSSFGEVKKKLETTGQVAEKIRKDPRLFSLERTNARRLTSSMLPRGAPKSYDIATLDVSFISVLKVCEREKRDGEREREKRWRERESK